MYEAGEWLVDLENEKDSGRHREGVQGKRRDARQIEARHFAETTEKASAAPSAMVKGRDFHESPAEPLRA